MDYNRVFDPSAEPTSLSPMNRVVDAANPESEVSRRFLLKVDDFLASSCKDGKLGGDLAADLSRWAAYDGKLQALAQRSAFVKDAAPASAALSQSAALTLAALERIHEGLPLPEALKKQDIDALKAFESQAHKAQLPIPALAAFQKLVEAAGQGGACTASK